MLQSQVNEVHIATQMLNVVFHRRIGDNVVDVIPVVVQQTIVQFRVIGNVPVDIGVLEYRTVANAFAALFV